MFVCESARDVLKKKKEALVMVQLLLVPVLSVRTRKSEATRSTQQAAAADASSTVVVFLLDPDDPATLDLLSIRHLCATQIINKPTIIILIIILIIPDHCGILCVCPSVCDPSGEYREMDPELNCVRLRFAQSIIKVPAIKKLSCSLSLIFIFLARSLSLSVSLSLSFCPALFGVLVSNNVHSLSFSI